MKLSLYPSAPDLSSGTVIGVQSGATVQFPLSLFLSSSAAQFAPIESPTFTGTVSGITASMVGLGNVNNTSDANKPISTPTQIALDLKAPVANPTFTGNVSGITANMVGLGNVSNTADIDKPISLATQTALNLKASLASPTFTGTVFGITAEMVGLGNVDNTGDYGKPVSTATQQALNAKANIASPTFTGTVNGITAAMVGLGNVNNTSDANKPVSTATQNALNALSTTVSTTIQSSIDLKAPLASPAFTGTVTGITKAMVGLGNADDTSDVNKPVSTATQTALNLKAPIASPTFTGTVSGITATMVGLGNVNNTSDLDKPVSTAVQSGYTPKQDGTRSNLDYNTTLTSGLYNVDTAPTNGPSGVSANQLFVLKGTDTGLQVSGGSTFDMYHRGWTASGGSFTAWKKVWDTTNLTNLNQLTNGPGFISGITSGMVTTALGYTPVNKAGDTITGGITVSSGNIQTSAGDIKTSRAGGTTGALYFGTSDTRYIYYDGTSYQMPGAPLTLNGSNVWTAGNLTNLNQLTNGPGYLTGITSAQVTSALGYSPVNKAGDTVSGNLVVSGLLQSQGIQFGGSVITGFYSDGSNIGIRAYGGASSIYFSNSSGSSTLGTWGTGGLSVNTAANFASTLTVSGSTVWTAANLANVSQLANNSGYTVPSGAYTWSAPQIFNSTHTINTTIDGGVQRLNAGYWYDGNDNTYYIDINNTSVFNTITGNGIIQSNASLRSPIFYDSANTGYYLQPRGQSRLGTLNMDYNQWNISAEGYNRLHFGYGDATYICGGNSGTYNMCFQRQGEGTVYLMYASNFYAQGNIIAYWSDRRLKENLEPIADWRKIIDNLTGYRFEWNEYGRIVYAGAEKGKREVGLIAQDVREVYPEAVSIQELQYKSQGVPKDGINYDPNDPYITIQYDKLIPVLVQSEKAAHDKLDDHDDKLDEHSDLLRQILARLEMVENGKR